MVNLNDFLRRIQQSPYPIRAYNPHLKIHKRKISGLKFVKCSPILIKKNKKEFIFFLVLSGLPKQLKLQLTLMILEFLFSALELFARGLAVVKLLKTLWNCCHSV